MAALSEDNRAEAETLLGVLTDDEADDVGDRYTRWGSVGFAALELLMTRHSSMVADPLVIRIEGDAQWDWRKNLAALGQKITALVAMLAAEDAVSNEARRQLVTRAAAMAANAPVVTMTDYVVQNKRPMSRASSSLSGLLGRYGRF